MRKKRKANRIRKDTSTKARKTVKRKKTAAKRRTAAPKTRNSGKWSEGEFWQFIRSSLRNRTRFWGPKLEVLKAARRPSQSVNKRLKWEFQCAHCKDWFPQTQVQVHHKEPAGSLMSGDDLKMFVERLFCEKDGLEVTCKECHKLEHKKS